MARKGVGDYNPNPAVILSAQSAQPVLSAAEGKNPSEDGAATKVSPFRRKSKHKALRKQGEVKAPAFRPVNKTLKKRGFSPGPFTIGHKPA